MDEEQLETLSSDLLELNDALEDILSHQFGVENEKWIEAMSEIENGLSKAVVVIAEEKGYEFEENGGVLLDEDLENILED
jgi:ElaB/YqjD/DUF883 family membrane-anchored ribosome-binding protein